MVNSAVYHPIGSATAVWMPQTNHYVLAAPPADEIAKLLAMGKESREIVDYCEEVLGIPKKQAIELQNSIRREIAEQSAQKKDGEKKFAEEIFDSRLEADLYSERCYLIYGHYFKVIFSTPVAEFLIHPRFAHLECRPESADSHHFKICHQKGHYALYADRERAGVWPQEHSNRVVGEFFLRVMEKTFFKKSDQWMAVLHAACVSDTDGENSVVFAGDTGAGKSTLAALLYSSGCDVLADDFLPLEGESGRACSFPAAISVNEKAVKLLSAKFPGLTEARAYHYPNLGKTVRYLPVRGNLGTEPRKACCRALVFVNYEPGSAFNLEEVSPEDAFARLVPDTWIQPSEKNARRFLEWFAGLKHYQLTYSDNEKMVKEVMNHSALRA